MRKIACKQFVGAVTRQGHLHMRGDRLGDEIGGDHTRKRLIERANDVVELLRELIKGDEMLMVLGAVTLGHHAGEAPVIVLVWKSSS